MKKIIFAAALIVSCFTAKFSQAQIHISLGLNIGSQPDWGPVGYDHAEYYYMPDIDTYYDVNAHQYVYFENNVWVHRTTLPPRYANYDLYHGYKAVVNEPTPWVHADVIRRKYVSYRGHHDQVVIRDSKDVKYKNHWHDNGHHNGDDHDHGRGHDDHGHH